MAGQTKSSDYIGAVRYIVKTAEMLNEGVTRTIIAGTTCLDNDLKQNSTDLMLVTSLALFSFLQGVFNKLPPQSHAFVSQELIYHISEHRRRELKNITQDEIVVSINRFLGWFNELNWTEAPSEGTSARGNAFWEISKVILDSHGISKDFGLTVAVGWLLAKTTQSMIHDGEGIASDYKEIWLKNVV